MLTSRQWRKHRTSIIFGGIILTSLAFSSEDISRNLQSISSIKAQIATNSEQQTKLEQQLAFEQEQARIADARYQNGCLPIVVGSYPRIRYVSIFEGQTLTDRHTKQPLPSGTVVCDGQGNTGVIEENGTVGAIAFTGNRDLVAKRLKRFRGGIYSQPIADGEN
ncbi:hypothetical protein H6G80_27120 [Nostoc sp. FACHB-87]|uniref:hypothetical protein n=1 Tax=Nostocales TaxID=1161 RepID=UPI0016840B17|nr:MULTISPECIES: hypothetical protein [Nostocales]MBD2457730.1 hypothetical protein [Nostoc sp. FACHB-87]MBD2478807.1 hypothetical protein [Anabaena sp. FACHB-83]MBD2492584.1 hypothetical protein [Aulosira sp. FACHB-615]